MSSLGQSDAISDAARSLPEGLTDLLQLRHVANLMFKRPGTDRIASREDTHTVQFAGRQG